MKYCGTLPLKALRPLDPEEKNKLVAMQKKLKWLGLLLLFLFPFALAVLPFILFSFTQHLSGDTRHMLEIMAGLAWICTSAFSILKAWDYLRLSSQLKKSLKSTSVEIYEGEIGPNSVSEIEQMFKKLKIASGTKTILELIPNNGLVIKKNGEWIAKKMIHLPLSELSNAPESIDSVNIAQWFPDAVPESVIKKRQLTEAEKTEVQQHIQKAKNFMFYRLCFFFCCSYFP